MTTYTIVEWWTLVELLEVLAIENISQDTEKRSMVFLSEFGLDAFNTWSNMESYTF